MLSTFRRRASRLLSLAQKEESVLRTLHGETRAKLKRLEGEDAGLKDLLRRAYAYAVFPSVGKAAAVIGGAFGMGEVFRKDDLVGYAAVAQLTIGIQLGGDTFAEVIAFEDEAAFGRFTRGRWAFSANASAVAVSAGAAASANYENGAVVFVRPEGGLLLEAALGAQKLFFRPAVLGRAKQAPSTKNTSQSGSPRGRRAGTGTTKRGKKPGAD